MVIGAVVFFFIAPVIADLYDFAAGVAKDTEIRKEFMDSVNRAR